jgi:hypothetical protein
MTTIPFAVIAVVALSAAAIGSIWRFHAARKWRKLLDTYADQEIAREWRRHQPADVRSFGSFAFSRRGENGHSRRNFHARSES